jgi:hypothetical protein
VPPSVAASCSSSRGMKCGQSLLCALGSSDLIERLCKTTVSIPHRKYPLSDYSGELIKTRHRTTPTGEAKWPPNLISTEMTNRDEFSFGGHPAPAAWDLPVSHRVPAPAGSTSHPEGDAEPSCILCSVERSQSGSSHPSHLGGSQSNQAARPRAQSAPLRVFGRSDTPFGRWMTLRAVSN